MIRQLRSVTHLAKRLARVEEQLREQVRAWRLEPVVSAYQALRGVQFHVATTIAREMLAFMELSDPPGRLRGK